MHGNPFPPRPMNPFGSLAPFFGKRLEAPDVVLVISSFTCALLTIYTPHKGVRTFQRFSNRPRLPKRVSLSKADHFFSSQLHIFRHSGSQPPYPKSAFRSSPLITTRGAKEALLLDIRSRSSHCCPSSFSRDPREPLDFSPSSGIAAGRRQDLSFACPLCPMLPNLCGTPRGSQTVSRVPLLDDPHRGIDPGRTLILADPLLRSCRRCSALLVGRATLRLLALLSPPPPWGSLALLFSMSSGGAFLAASINSFFDFLFMLAFIFGHYLPLPSGRKLLSHMEDRQHSARYLPYVV